jgi:Ion transport protein
MCIWNLLFQFHSACALCTPEFEDLVIWLTRYQLQRVVQMNEVLNVCLTFYFLLEMVIKVVALGIKGYLADPMNACDGAVVISSLVEIVVFLQGGGRGTLSVFRAFRLMRVFKLARRWRELNKIVRTIFKSLPSIAYLSLLLLVFVFIMALLGMQTFGYKCVLPISCSSVNCHHWARLAGRRASLGSLQESCLARRYFTFSPLPHRGYIVVFWLAAGLWLLSQACVAGLLFVRSLDQKPCVRQE